MRRAAAGVATACTAGTIMMFAPTGAEAATSQQVPVQRGADGQLLAHGTTSQVGEPVVLPPSLVRAQVAAALAEAKSTDPVANTVKLVKRTVEGTTRLVGGTAHALGLGGPPPPPDPDNEPAHLAARQQQDIEAKFDAAGPIDLASTLTGTGGQIDGGTVAHQVAERVHGIVARDYPNLDPSLAHNIDQRVDARAGTLGDISENVTPTPSPAPPTGTPPTGSPASSTPTGGVPQAVIPASEVVPAPA
ncbi:MAG: hypothetical protein ACRDRN_16415, partial [Sciscionella sp.]